jgi:FixJ family two-component response regulator
LATDELVADTLRDSLCELNARVQRYASLGQLLASSPPPGPVGLVADLEGLTADGVLLCRQLKLHGWQFPILVLDRNMEVRPAVTMMRAGAENILLKTASAAELLGAVGELLQLARRNWLWFSRRSQACQRVARLTPREREVVKLVMEGMLNKEIAQKLGLALVTVKVHRAAAMQKIGARNAAELARLVAGPNPD